MNCVVHMKTAIFCLTRGYPDPFMYSRLIARNKSIEKLIGTFSELVVFHEGNIHPEHQRIIETETPTLKFKWIQIPFQFPTDVPLPHETIITFRDGSCYPGYHVMCEFHTCDVWDHLKDYDVVLRVDEDCILESEKWADVFTCVSPEVQYKTPMFDVETHDMTNVTLPQWLAEDAKFYDRTMPYTNVFVTRMDIWNRDDVRGFIKRIRESRGCIKYRWGDHVLHSVILKKFGIGHGTMEGYDYYHGSHDRHVKN
jgi:hypothetical protein